MESAPKTRYLAFPVACASLIATSVALAANGPSTDAELRAALRVVRDAFEGKQLPFDESVAGRIAAWLIAHRQ